jgi:hypothetical protein
MKSNHVLIPVLALGLVFGCGGSGLSTSKQSSPGTLSLRLGSDSIPGYSRVVVGVEKVEWSADGSNYFPLGDVKGTVDLAALQNGNAANAIFLPAVSLSPTTIAKFRITWATTNYDLPAPPVPAPAAYVTTNAGSGVILGMPLTTVVTGPVTVASGAMVQVQIMLSGDQAIQARTGTTAYTFQPTARAYDLAATGKITGHLGAGTTDLGGVEVYAESLTAGVPAILRRSFTDATGNYVLDALPAGNPTYVVAQPAGTITAYAAMASDPKTITAATAYTTNLAFTSATAPGTLSLAVTPASLATDGTWAELRQTLPTGTSGFQPLIVRSLTATTGAAADQMTFVGLAPGIFDVTIQRSTAGAAALPKLGVNQQVVNAGSVTSYSLTYP